MLVVEKVRELDETMEFVGVVLMVVQEVVLRVNSAVV